MESVKVEFEVQEEKYDNSNPLIIVGKRKKEQKHVQKQTNTPKPLSKKKKKKLEKILARKRRKINRAELLEKLSKVQAKPQELDYLTSTSSMQTHGIKRLLQENTTTEINDNIKISNIKGCNKKKSAVTKKIKLDPNVVEFEISSTDSDNESIDVNDDQDDIKEVNETKNNNFVKVQFEGSQEASSENSAKEIANKTKDKSVLGKNIPDESSNVTSGKSEIKEKKMSELTSTEKAIPVPAVFVHVNRQPEIQAAREALPIYCEEQSIMEAVQENSVVVIHGETGSGKTTQVPQFLYEGGYTQNNKMIGITEPRRIAAMTMASRIGIELNKPDVVAYHVRYENNITENTEIKLMTDGILLKEIRHDFLLSRYSVIIIDEAHERSVFSDVLIGLLSRIVPLREKRGNPLKLIIMSATIRVQDFTENPSLFKKSPFLIRVDSRQYKVQVHFNIHTPTDYIEAAYNKVCKIHSQLPAGAILVFLTGEKEVIKLCKMLRNTYPFKDNSYYKSENWRDSEKCIISSNTIKKRRNKKSQPEDASFCSVPSQINLDDYSVEPLDPEDEQHEISDEEDSDEIKFLNIKKSENFTPLYTLPLYSILPVHEQEKIFQPPPVGSRLCVISTNVAETSITIPGLKYVVDSGKVKTKVYNRYAGGISQFCITWTSKASANQRAGRAGRTEGGHCYRLYSSSVFEHDFPDFSPPEIQTIPVDDVLLQMKALGIDRVVNFPFPTPPDNEALKAAERRLVLLGALQDLNKGERYKDIKKWEYSAKATLLGKAMARFPLSPRFAKMLLLSYKHQCVPYIIAIVSAMTVPEVFLKSTSDIENDENSEQKSPWKGIKNISAGSGKSLMLGDAMVLLRAVALFEKSKNKVQFCLKNDIRHKAMVEIHKMRVQLNREMNRAFSDLCLPLDLNLEPPTDEQIEKIIKIITTGFTDHVARLLPQEEMKLNKDLKNAYKCLDLEEPVFIHPSSILFSELPRYIVYQEIVHTSKYYMKGIVEIYPECLPAFVPTLCNFSEPLEEPAPVYDSERDQILCTMNVNFGRWQWELPPVNMEMPKGLLKYSWFSFFLLEGQVHKIFKEYRKHLLSSPSIVLKSWAKLLPRTRYLLQALIAKEVDSKMTLVETWKKEPKFLLREYWEWLPQEKHMELECKWPPI